MKHQSGGLIRKQKGQRWSDNGGGMKKEIKLKRKEAQEITNEKEEEGCQREEEEGEDEVSYRGWWH